MHNPVAAKPVSQISIGIFSTSAYLKSAVVGLSLTGSLLLTACSTLPVDDRAISTSSTNTKRPVIALVLGGGGAKGFAHVGVIKALEANNITPNLVVGTSVGSFVGSLYASGKSATDLESIARTTPDSELTDFTLSYQGIIEGEKLRNFVNNQVNHKSIESFPIRFAAVAAEKHTLKKAVFTEGEAGLIVQASSSVPNVFIAPRIPDPKASGQIGKKYVDGGVVSIVPVDAAKALGADVVIAVDLQVDKESPSQAGSKNKSLWSLIEQGYNTYNKGSTANKKSGPYTQNYETINKAEIGRADVIIRPDVANISAISTVNREAAIEAGVKATEQNLPTIRAAIQKAQLIYSQSN
ncbi:patatin-like phospholipase family protein [Psychrobacter sanguinis]|uniref:patatin-like phospholipase family protein n=1 Tax=Psychrobacter sanguinis TaxID=861445 RepID=UPI002A74A53B|nr:patatin-like phospholipase family protein [Psychrobacter sanguinis]MDY3307504.1 patatin-like phospholipase family protein [Psychrobacter sanguinis]